MKNDQFHLTVVRGIIVELDQNGEVKILLCKNPASKRREGKKWGLPGGKVEGEEEELAALYREILGETGIHFIPRYFVHKIQNSRPQDPNLKSILHKYYLGTGEATSPCGDEEHDDKPTGRIWINPQGLTTLPLTVSANKMAPIIRNLDIRDILTNNP